MKTISTTTNNILFAPPSEWRERTEKAKDRQEIENELANLLQRAALLHDYLAHRFNTGCGDQGHESSARHANKTLVKVRKAMGYSYPTATAYSL